MFSWKSLTWAKGAPIQLVAANLIAFGEQRPRTDTRHKDWFKDATHVTFLDAKRLRPSFQHYERIKIKGTLPVGLHVFACTSPSTTYAGSGGVVGAGFGWSAWGGGGELSFRVNITV